MMPEPMQEMLLLSRILGTEVIDREGRGLGRLHDLNVASDGEYPPVIGVVVRKGRQQQQVPWRQVLALRRRCLLNVPVRDAEFHPVGQEGFLLRRDVLDKQIVDIDGGRVVRVNDILLAYVGDSLRLVSVDPTTRGLLRHLGLEKVLDWLLARLHITFHQHFIAWRDVEPLDTQQRRLRLTLPAHQLARLHPADIAEIVGGLDPQERLELIGGLDAETAGDALSDMDTDMQASILTGLAPEMASDILEEMEHDEAADVLGELTAEESAKLLSGMEEHEAAPVRALLEYDEDTAGGLMTNDFLAVPQTFSAEQTIEYLRRHASEAEYVYYVYVTDADGKLAGVLSLRRLLVAPPEQPVGEIMTTPLVHAHADDGAEAVAHAINKYDLLALPVVDEAGTLKGVVTVDDVVDLIIPPRLKRRLLTRRRGG